MSLANILGSVNDLYSLRNEVHSGNGASLVTLSLDRDLGLPQAIEQVMGMIDDSIHRFDHHAEALLETFAVERRGALNNYFDSLRGLVTGYHTWW